MAEMSRLRCETMSSPTRRDMNMRGPLAVENGLRGISRLTGAEK